MLLSNILVEKEKKNPCWDGYEMVGTKKVNGKKVPNCVKKEDAKKNYASNCACNAMKTNKDSNCSCNK